MMRSLSLVLLMVVVPGDVFGQTGTARDLVVRGLSFSGNHAVDDLTLRASIATTQSSAFARWPLVRWIGLGEKRYFNETDFRVDTWRIRLLYDRSGYREATVDTLVRRTNGNVYARFIIDEGEPVRVVSLRVTGIDGIVDANAVVRDLPLQVGDPFNLILLQTSVDSLRMILGNHGYPLPEVFQNFDVDLANHRADVSFHVVSGRPATIEAIEISGTAEVGQDVIQRALSFKQGELFSSEKLRKSQLDLYRLNLFNYVGMELVDTLSRDPEDSTIAVRVRVAEAALRRIRLGAGYGTYDCFRGLGAWTIYDFLGGGRTLDLSVQFSKVGVGDPIDFGLENGVCWALASEDSTRLKLNYNLGASLREPFFFSRRTSAGITVAAERYSEFQAYLQEQYGAEFSLTWRTPVEIPITASYSFSRARTDADPATFCAFLDVCLVEDTRVFTERRSRATIGLGYVWDRTDSPVSATRGTRLSGEFRHASDMIGSDSLIQFTRGIAELASFHRVSRRSVFAWRVRFGAVKAAGKSGYVPPEDRLYGGGPNSVRGYAQNELGPLVRVLDRVTVDTATGKADSIIRRSATGGDRLLLATAELRFPLSFFSPRVFGALFVDAGQVIESETSEDPLYELRVTPGVGFRVATALGPMRLDVGFNPYAPQASHLYVEDTSTGELVTDTDNLYTPSVDSFISRLRLHFSVGQAF